MGAFDRVVFRGKLMDEKCKAFLMAMEEKLGYELTGRYLDDVPERDMRAYLDSTYRRVAAEGLALHESGERVLDRRVWRHESMLLPCCAADGAVSLIISARVTQPPVDAETGLPAGPG